MATYEVELGFSMRCVTRGWTIEAESAEEAERKAQEAIARDDFDAFGGADVRWDTMDGSDHDYAVIDVIGEVE
jgi:hypothetical protein